jgi:hypothetical protein
MRVEEFGLFVILKAMMTAFIKEKTLSIIVILSAAKNPSYWSLKNKKSKMDSSTLAAARLRHDNERLVLKVSNDDHVYTRERNTLHLSQGKQ